MSIKFNFAKTNDEAAVATGLLSFVGLLVEGSPTLKAAELAILAGGAVLGFTGFSSVPAA